MVLWATYAVNLGTAGPLDRAGQLKGADFLQFYVMGHLAADGAGDVLYDAAAFATETRRLVPAKVETFPPVYPPQVSVFLQPLSQLSYGWATIVWSLVSATVYALACVVVWCRCSALRSHRGLVLALAVGSPAFFNLITHGQASSPAALLLALMVVALSARRPVWAGLALGLIAYKPQIEIAAAVTFVFAREWRIVAGAALVGAAELTIGWEHYGTETMLAYLQVLAQPAALTMIVEQKLHHSHSLRTLWALLLPWRPLALTGYVLSAAWVLWLTIHYWRSQAPAHLRCAALLVATVLVSPHLFVYDLVILAPPLLLLMEWSLANPDHPSSPAVRVLLAGAFLAPLVGPLAIVTRVQVSVPILVALFWLVTQLPTAASGRPAQLAPAGVG